MHVRDWNRKHIYGQWNYAAFYLVQICRKLFAVLLLLCFCLLWCADRCKRLYWFSLSLPLWSNIVYTLCTLLYILCKHIVCEHLFISGHCIFATGIRWTKVVDAVRWSPCVRPPYMHIYYRCSLLCNTPWMCCINYNHCVLCPCHRSLFYIICVCSIVNISQ